MKKIILSALFSCAYCSIAFPKDVVIKGNVTDLKGEPLIGVNISIPGLNMGTISDLDGNYSIKIDDVKVRTLKFSYIGYLLKEEPIDGRKVVNVILQEDVGQLDEVVVVGYGTQKKESVVGAITTIDPEMLRSSTTRTISNNLAGQVPGIIAVQRSGEPGFDSSSFWIRGISTFQSQRNPLVLVDGIERNLNDIDASEIESFSVLKDAAASAVYGVRGANGIILVNTKRGRVGKPTVNVTVEQAMTSPTKLPEFVDGARYMEIINSIRKENGMSPEYSDKTIYNTRNGVDPDLYPNVNWIDLLTKKYASNTRVTLDVNGGTERLRYSFVAAYYGENGILNRDTRNEWNSALKVQRYNIRSNVDINVTPTTLLRFNIGGYMQSRRATPESIDYIFAQAFETTPIVHPAQYSTGEFPEVPQRQNPYVLAMERGFKTINNSKIESLFSLEQDLKFITPGLKVKGTFSFDSYSENSVTREKWPDRYNVATGRDPLTGNLLVGSLIDKKGSEYLGYKKGSEYGNRSTYLELNISYNRVFGKNHALDAMLMSNWRNYDIGDKQPYRSQGLAGRLSYTFRSRYIGEFNFGYNGSENFEKGHRYGFFPSVAIGWLLSEEKFMSPVRNIFSKIKFRASYGSAGNGDIAGRRFPYLSNVEETTAYDFGYNRERIITGLWEGAIGTPNLTWETVYKSDIGIELELWRTVSLQFDYFKERRRDIFMKRQNFPSSAGFSEAPWANYGKVDNGGFELSMQINRQFSKDLFFSAQANFTYAKNKILEMDEESAKKGTYRSVVGRSVGQLEGYVADGLFTDADFIDVKNGTLAPGVPVQSFSSVLRPGDIKYKDLNADGKVDALDKTAIGGTVDPRVVYGFGANVAYKNFDLGILFQGNARTWQIIGGKEFFLPGGGNATMGNIYSNVDDRWTVDNPRQNVFYPRLTYGPNSNNSQPSTWWLKNMSMLRLKNVEFGYSLPRTILQKISLSKVRLYLRGTNLFCFSGFKLWDPEVETMDNNGLRYPIMKSYSIGLEIGF